MEPAAARRADLLDVISRQVHDTCGFDWSLKVAEVRA